MVRVPINDPEMTLPTTLTLVHVAFYISIRHGLR